MWRVSDTNHKAELILSEAPLDPRGKTSGSNGAKRRISIRSFAYNKKQDTAQDDESQQTILQYLQSFLMFNNLIKKKEADL